MTVTHGFIFSKDNWLHNSKDVSVERISDTPLKALENAQGTYLNLVMIEDAPKGKKTTQIVASSDVSDALRKYACEAAFNVVNYWQAIPDVLKYLHKPDESIRKGVYLEAMASAEFYTESKQAVQSHAAYASAYAAHENVLMAAQRASGYAIKVESRNTPADMVLWNHEKMFRDMIVDKLRPGFDVVYDKMVTKAVSNIDFGNGSKVDHVLKQDMQMLEDIMVAKEPEVEISASDALAESMRSLESIMVANDGRPMTTDEFLVLLREKCDDVYDRDAAIQAWIEGAWDEAMEYTQSYDPLVR